jgi:translation initiation factor 3 subunit B
VSWSPLGTYIASLHRQDVRLWGGPSWEQQQRFARPLVKLMDFSPREQYLVTWSNEPIVIPEGALQGPQYFPPDDEGHNIAVWDINSGDLLRTFSTSNPGDEHAGPKKSMQWPALKCSPGLLMTNMLPASLPVNRSVSMNCQARPCTGRKVLKSTV